MSQEKELWDVYDKDRNRTGRTHPRGKELAPGDYHLVVHVAIFNSRGELLIQRRQPWKHGFPNYWDLSAGGSALAGEDSRMAAHRETLEEIGLDLDFSEVHPKFTYYWDHGFDDYWFMTKDASILDMQLQEAEVAEVRWVNREGLIRLVEDERFVPYYFIRRIFDLYRGTGAIEADTGWKHV